jgi:phosphate transport system permease protein
MKFSDVKNFLGAIESWMYQKLFGVHTDDSNLLNVDKKMLFVLAKKHFKTKIFSLLSVLSLYFCFAVLVVLILFTFRSAFNGFTITTMYIPVEQEISRKIQSGHFDKNDIDLAVSHYFVENFKSSSSNKDLTNEELNITSLKVKKEIFGSFSKIYSYHQNLKDVLVCKEECFLKLRSSEDFDRYYKESALNKSEEENIPAYNLLISSLKSDNLIKLELNPWFFTRGDSEYAESAGIATSLKGTMYTVLIFLIFCIPMAVITAIYLEEFSKQNKFKSIIEININNLAAVPSIIYGLLGLLIYIKYMHLPRSSAIVGSLTLSLLVMPVLIVSVRNSIRTVPQILRDITFALGASKSRVVFNVVLPAAMPGILTGVILAITRMIGETAPLLIIGMVAFVGDIPADIFDPSTTISVQIYLWSSSPEYLLINKASSLIILLIAYLFVSNLIINFVRKKFEVKWQ